MTWNRKAILFAFTALITLSVFPSCSQDGQVLAEYQGGKITRGELRTLLSLYQSPEVLEQINVNQQTAALNNYAVMKIAALKGEADGLEKSPDFYKRALFINEWASVMALQKNLQNGLMHKKFQMAALQFVFLRNSGPEVVQKGRDLTVKLNSGLSDPEIEELIRDNTDNQRYAPLGGYMEPQCISCAPNPIQFLVNGEPDSYNREFVTKLERTGIWIFRVVQKFEVKGSDLQDVFSAYYKKIKEVSTHLAPSGQNPEVEKWKDEDMKKMGASQAEAMLRREERGLFPNLINKRQTETQFSMATDLQKPAEEPVTDDTILFTSSSEKFTFGDLRKPLKEMGVEITPEEELQIAQRVVIPYHLFQGTPEMDEAVDSPLFSFIKSLKQNEIRAGLWIEKNRPNPQVTDDEISQWYEVRKNTEYKGKKLADVREEIGNRLQKSKFQDVFQNFQKKLLEDNNLVIHTDRLKPEGI